MWLKRAFEVYNRLTFRLVFWNIAAFLLAAVITLVIIDARIRAYLDKRQDRQLETKLLEIKGLNTPDLSSELFLAEFVHHSAAMGADRLFYRLLDDSGQAVVNSDLTPWSHLPFETISYDQAKPGQFQWQTLHGWGRVGASARVLSQKLTNGGIVQVGLSTFERDELQAKARFSISAAMVLVALLASILTILVVSQVLKGMRYLSKGVVRIAKEGNFEHRILLPTGSRETDDLAYTFNDVFAKIQDLMIKLEQVLGDIAHDMRTPVTRLRGAAESIISEPDVSPREEDLAGNTIEECDRILGLVNTILEITAAEANMLGLRPEPLDLVQEVRQGTDLFQFMMEDKGLSLRLDLPRRLLVQADRRALQRVLSNLLDNAIKYSCAGGIIVIYLYTSGPMARLTVADSGLGVPAGESELIFRRFYRSDKSRTLPGNGLGLTFCRAVISGMGGQIWHEPPATGSGSVFVVELAIADEGLDSDSSRPPAPGWRSTRANP